MTWMTSLLQWTMRMAHMKHATDCQNALPLPLPLPLSLKGICSENRAPGSNVEAVRGHLGKLAWPAIITAAKERARPTYMAALYAAMAVVRSRGNNSGIREKHRGFWVACAAANPTRSASSSLKLCTCTKAGWPDSPFEGELQEELTTAQPLVGCQRSLAPVAQAILSSQTNNILEGACIPEALPADVLLLCHMHLPSRRIA